MKGKIILVPFPFTDLKSVKRRPALVLLERENDVVVAFISSKMPISIEKSVIIINKSHKEFNLTGLKVDSVIYLDKLATISKDLIKGELGEVGKKLKSEINRCFKKTYHF